LFHEHAVLRREDAAEEAIDRQPDGLERLPAASRSSPGVERRQRQLEAMSLPEGHLRRSCQYLQTHDIAVIDGEAVDLQRGEMLTHLRPDL
jgi:hypothetical protein